MWEVNRFGRQTKPLNFLTWANQSNLFYIFFLIPIFFFQGTLLAEMSLSEAIKKSNSLYKALTGGVPLLASNPLYSQILNLVKNKDYLGAATLITDPLRGADEFYNNVVAALPQTMNQKLTAVGPRNELSAMFLVTARDGFPVDTLLKADFTAIDPNGTPAGVKYGIDDSGCGNSFSAPGTLCNSGHYIQVWETTNPKLSLKRVAHPKVPGIGIFTSWPWVQNYDTAGTGRRNIKGVMENLYLVFMDALRTNGIPTDGIRQDVPRSEAQFVQNCTQCHHWMDKLVRPFLVKDVTASGAFVYGFRDKLNDIQSPDYPVTDTVFDWFYTPDQAKIFDFDEKLLAVQTYSATGVKYIHGTNLADFANMVANSKGFYRGLVKRIIAQIYMKQLFSLATFSNDDLAVLNSQSDTIETFTQVFYINKNLRDIYHRIAIWYALD